MGFYRLLKGEVVLYLFIKYKIVDIRDFVYIINNISFRKYYF